MTKIIFVMTLILLMGCQNRVVAQTQTETGSDIIAVTEILPRQEKKGTDRLNRLSIRFNRDVSPLSDMHANTADLPIQITPKLACDWYWVNGRMLACDLSDRDRLKLNSQYQINIQPTPLFSGGPRLAKPHHHRFTTTRLNLTHTDMTFKPENRQPVVHLRFNQPVAAENVLKMSFIEGENGDRVATNLYGEIATEFSYHWRLTPDQTLASGEKYALNISTDLQGREGDLGLSTQQQIKIPTLSPFQVKTVTCRDLQDPYQDISKQPIGKKLSIDNNSYECHPEYPVQFKFSAPVDRENLAKFIDISPPLTAAQHQQWQNILAGLPKIELVANRSYLYAFLNNVPGRSHYQVTFKKGLTDILGRQLGQDLRVNMGFGLSSAMADMIYDQVVIEKNPKIAFPLYTRNLQKAEINAQLYSKRQGYLTRDIPLKISNILEQKIAIPLKPQSWLKGEAGLIVGQLKTEPIEGAFFKYQRDQDWPFLAQITPFNIHFKYGAQNGLIWVTDLASGQSVTDAKISIRIVKNVNYRDRVKALLRRDYQVLFEGRTYGEGLLALPDAGLMSRLETCLNGECAPYIQVEKGADIAVLPIAYRYETPIYQTSGGEWLSRRFLREKQDIESWGLTAQGVHRPGDQVSYKLFFKNQTLKGLSAPTSGQFAYEIKSPDGKVLEPKRSITLSETGSYAGQVKLPTDAMLGWYRMVLYANDRELYQGGLRFLVTEFVPASFKVITDIQAKSVLAGQKLSLTGQAQLYSGGAYQYGDIKLGLSLKSRPFRPNHPHAKGYEFNFVTEKGKSLDTREVELWEAKFSLEKGGKVATNQPIKNDQIIYGRLTLEGQVADERGKRQSHRTAIPFAGRDRFIGLKSPKWLYQAGETTQIPVIVTDMQGAAQANTKISIDIQRQIIKRASVKSAGATYVDQAITEWQTESKCQVMSGKQAQSCAFTPKKGGVYRLFAKGQDQQKRLISSLMQMWVQEPGAFVNWPNSQNKGLTLLTDKNNYQVGDTARIMVQNPYPGATALVTVERNGILSHKQYHFQGGTPVIDIPILPEYAPKAYLSVSIFSPRQPSEDMPKLGEVDLAKPTQKTGYLALSVRDPNIQLTPQITTFKKTYQPGERVSGHVSLPADQAQKVEYSLIAIDQAVLDLMPGGSTNYDPILGLTEAGDLGVKDFQLLTQLLGRQKISKKGATLGGDGVANAAQKVKTRQNFKEIAYWDPMVISDDQGRAHFAFTLPDNLTGWRLFAIAMTPGAQRGMQSATLKVSQQLEIKPAMPTHLKEGDQAQLAFSLYNRTDQPQTYQYRWQVRQSGRTETSQGQVRIAAYQRQRLEKSVTAAGPVSQSAAGLFARQGQIDITLSASAETGGSDAMALSLPVIYDPLRVIGIRQEKLTEPGPHKLDLSLPKTYMADRSVLGVTLTASAIRDVQSLFEEMGHYPYQCWEQRASRTIVASYYPLFKADLSSDFAQTAWTDIGAYPDQQLSEIGKFQRPDGGMSYYGGAWSQSDPGLSAYTILMLKRLKEAGYQIPTAVADRLTAYLKRYLADKGQNIATQNITRLMAYLARGRDDRPSQQDIVRAYPDQNSDLFQHSLWLQLALTQDAGRYLSEDMIKSVDLIMARARETATSLTFDISETAGRGWHGSDLRTQCGVLSALSQWQADDRMSDDQWDLQGRLPLIVNGIELAIKGKTTGYGLTTQEASFCSQAFADYRSLYEANRKGSDWSKQSVTVKIGDTQILPVFKPTSLQSAPLKGKIAAGPYWQKGGAKADQAGSTSVTLEKQGVQPLYLTAKISAVKQQPDLKRRDSGLPIQREYSVLRDNQWVLVTKSTPLKRGDTIRVDLYLMPGASHRFVVVNDPVPAAFEPVPELLANTASVPGANLPPAKGAYWWQVTGWQGVHAPKGAKHRSSQFQHRETGHKSVRFHALHLSAGPTHLRYYAQIVAAGKFKVPSVIAEKMYQPEVRGHGVTMQINVQE